MVKVVHHNDADGRCAAHVVAEFEGMRNRGDFFEINYGIPLPLKDISKDERVYIVDYSPEPEEMDELLKITKDIIWIDHHKTTIEKYKDYPYHIEGARIDGIAGCVLTYMTLWNVEEESVPYYIRLIGDRDIWAWKFGEDTKNFTTGLLTFQIDPLNSIWQYIPDSVSNIIESGAIINEYKYQTDKDYLEQYGYETIFEGHRAIAVNRGHAGSELFDSLEKKPPLMILYVDEGERYRVSLRSEVIDVSEIAVKYGGGGHAGAAGLECKELPWK